MSRNYGLVDDDHAMELAQKVVTTFGGGHTALQMLIGAACAETLLGRYPDRHPDKWGVGLTQFDRIGFVDVQRRTRTKDKKKLFKHHGYNLDELKLEDLADDPELAFCFTRLAYKLIPDRFPKELEGQAKYWKEHYNTEAGDGTPEQYVRKFKKYAPLGAR